MRFVRFSLLLLLVCAVSTISQAQTQIVVFAASSLTDAFEEIAGEFEAANPGVEVLFNFAGSSDLAVQLAEGAPADIFASANARQMSAVQDAGRIAGAPRIFARNRLTIIVPSDNPAAVGGLRDLVQDGLTLVIAAGGVPVRDYTESMLAALAADADFGQSYVDAFRANIVSEEPNVRQVAAKIALGEADAGIVYASDVTPDLREAVLSFEIPDAVNTIAKYPIAVVADSAQPEIAQAFVDYVLSDAGQAVLGEWGFVPAPPRRACLALGFIFPVCFG